MDLGSDQIGFALAFALVVLGVVLVYAASSAAKRLGGLVIASFGGLLALAAVTAPKAVFAVCVVALAAQVIIGAALLVRMQESYGGVDGRAVDSADEGDEREPAA